MTIYSLPGAVFEASVTNGASGLVGTIGVRIHNPITNTDVLARTTAGITEQPAASGIYFVSLSAPVTAGSYSVIWDDGASPPVYAADDLVVTSNLPAGTDLCALADVKLALGITATTSDTLLSALITDASKTIASRFQREFAPVVGTPTRRFRVDGPIVDLAPCDLRSVSGAGIVLDPAGTPTTLAASDYKLKPTPSLSGTFYKIHLRSSLNLSAQIVTDYGYTEIDVTGTWGFAVIPTDVARAAVITVVAWADRGADQIAGMDSTVRADGSTMAASWAIPVAAYRLLQPYMRIVP